MHTLPTAKHESEGSTFKEMLSELRGCHLATQDRDSWDGADGLVYLLEMLDGEEYHAVLRGNDPEQKVRGICEWMLERSPLKNEWPKVRSEVPRSMPTKQ
jgi:hypothetical protein